MNSIYLSLLTLSFLSVKTQAQDLVVANLKENVVYVGIDNKMAIGLRSGSIDSIELKVDHGEIINLNGDFVFRICDANQKLVTFRAFNRITQRLIGSYSYRINLLPDPKIKIYAFKTWEGVYLGNNILADATCVLPENATVYNLKIEILCFKVSIRSPDNNIEIISVSGSCFSAELRDKLSKLSDNSVVTFSGFSVAIGCENVNRILTEKLVFEKHGDKVLKID